MAFWEQNVLILWLLKIGSKLWVYRKNLKNYESKLPRPRFTNQAIKKTHPWLFLLWVRFFYQNNLKNGFFAKFKRFLGVLWFSRTPQWLWRREKSENSQKSLIFQIFQFFCVFFSKTRSLNPLKWLVGKVWKFISDDVFAIRILQTFKIVEIRGNRSSKKVW